MNPRLQIRLFHKEIQAWTATGAVFLGRYSFVNSVCWHWAIIAAVYIRHDILWKALKWRIRTRKDAGHILWWWAGMWCRMPWPSLNVLSQAVAEGVVGDVGRFKGNENDLRGNGKHFIIMAKPLWLQRPFIELVFFSQNKGTGKQSANAYEDSTQETHLPTSHYLCFPATSFPNTLFCS